MGGTVVMGRKTWDSLPPHVRPLPGRQNVVLSRDPCAHQFTGEGAGLVITVNDAEMIAYVYPDAWVIGGGQIYALLLPHCDELRVTVVPDRVEDGPLVVRMPPFEDQFDRVERTLSGALMFERWVRR